jgi:hypothetical protein
MVCSFAIVAAFDSHTCEYTVKALSMHSRLHTKDPYYAVVAVSRDGNEELKTRGGSLSSKGAKATVQADQRAAELEEHVKQLQFRSKADSANALKSVLFSGDWRSPRLNFKGRELARKLFKRAKKRVLDKGYGGESKEGDNNVYRGQERSAGTEREGVEAPEEIGVASRKENRPAARETTEEHR